MHLVRPASRDDLGTIVHFMLEEAREAEAKTPDPMTVERGVLAALSGKVARYWVVIDGSTRETLGSSSVYEEWSDWNNAAYWWLQSFYLVPQARGKGIAQQVLDHIEAEAIAAGAIELRLYVHQENARARAAYVKAGFAGMPYEMLSRRLRP